MKKLVLIFLMLSTAFILFSDDIVIYRDKPLNVTEYYDFGAFKVGFSETGAAKGDVLKRIAFDGGKVYFAATAIGGGGLPSLSGEIFSDFESSVMILETDGTIKEKGDWEMYRLSFNKPSKGNPLLNFKPSYSLDAAANLMDDIDSILSRVSPDTLYRHVAVLSGEDPYPQGTYGLSRVMVTPWLDTAYVYLKDVMDSMGFDSVWGQDFFVSSYQVKNVVGLKKGTIYHDTCIVIGAHYDDNSSNDYVAPGADDNASGSAGVLEAARVLMGVESDYDIYFVLFTAEEWGLYGSDYFVNDYILPNDMHVLGMVDFDMIGYNPSPTYDYDLYGMSHSAPLKSVFTMIADNFTTLTTHILGTSAGSDHYPFEVAGFKGAFAIEYDFSPVYHSPLDSIALLNFDFMKEIVQAGTGTVYYLSQMPLPVSDFTLTDNGDSSVNVSWTKSINNDIAAYKIYYIQEGETLERYSDAPDTNEFRIASLNPGMLYTFRIAPVDSTGIEAFTDAADTVRPSFVPNRILCIDAYGDNSNAYLAFHKSNAGDLSFYRIYRRKGTGSFSLIDSTSDTTFTDAGVADTSVLGYCVTAVDADGYESSPSDTMETRIVSLIKELLVIDETNNGGVATDAATDAFYDTVMGSFIYEIIDADSLSKTDLIQFGQYKRILYIDDDLNYRKLDYADLYRYVSAGGRVALVGWNVGKTILENPLTYPAFSDSDSYARTILGIDYYNRCTYNQLDYVNYTISGATDTIRFVEAKLPRGSSGALIYGGVFGLTSSSTPLGFYHSTVFDTAFHNKPLVFANDDTSAVVAAAPLFYMDTQDAKMFVRRILGLFGDLSSVCIAAPEREDVSVDFTSDFKSARVYLSGQVKSAEIYVADVSGRIVEKRILSTSEAGSWIEVGKNLKSGIYFIRAEAGDKTFSKKFTKLK